MRNLRAFYLSLLLLSSSTIAVGQVAPQDGGVFAVIGRDGKPGSLLYRFTYKMGKWMAEGKDGDAMWKDISCETGCEYKESSAMQAKSYLPQQMREKFSISCIQNQAQAFCKYVDLSNSSKGGYVVIALVTSPPTPIPVQRVR